MDGLPPEVRRLFEELRTGTPPPLPSSIPAEWWEHTVQTLVTTGRRQLRRRRVLAALALSALIPVVAVAGLLLGLAL